MTIVCFLVLTRKCEFIGFVKIIKNEVFTYHEIRLQKTIDEHLDFNEHITNIRKSTSREINALLRVPCVKLFHQWTFRSLSSYLDV